MLHYYANTQLQNFTAVYDLYRFWTDFLADQKLGDLKSVS